LGFEDILKNDMRKDDLSKNAYLHTFKDRVHMSKSKMDMYSDSAYLKIGEFRRVHYDDEAKRYIAATDLTYDIIISIYEINSRDMFVYRIFRYDARVRDEAAKFVESFKAKKHNFEARIIGLQSNQDFYFMLNELIGIVLDNRMSLVEVDLFGGNVRHIALDAKLGQSYNVLMEDRLYRPGELVNRLTIENFESQLHMEYLSKPIEPSKK